MKKTSWVLLSLFLVFTFYCEAQEETSNSKLKRKAPRKFKLAIDTVSETEKKSAYDLAYQTFTNCETYDFPILTTKIATEWLIKFWKEEKSKVIETCDKYNSTHGTLVKLNLSEILYDKTGYKYYRFKATFSKNQKIAEIRVYTNSKNKLDGIIIKPIWKNDYSEYNED
ncbi:hypothetical protein [uncultured Winogradskyella sp.]|uniref:hypothetical protein n=1 Tax=uncultured Winogradskyella sp. TaxID=395353 RepID=UPI0026378560|nr:hypothetical protein [uncultured Winogradskyella sp.]